MRKSKKQKFTTEEIERFEIRRIARNFWDLKMEAMELNCFPHHFVISDGLKREDGSNMRKLLAFNIPKERIKIIFSIEKQMPIKIEYFKYPKYIIIDF